MRFRSITVWLSISWCAAANANPSESSDRTTRVSEILHLQSMVERIQNARPAQPLETPIERLRLLEKATRQTATLYLGLEGFLGRLRYEEAQSLNGHDYVGNRRISTTGTLTAAGVTAGNALIVVGTSMVLASSYQPPNPELSHAGTGLLIGGAGVLLVLGTAALAVPTKGRLPAPIETGLLAQILDRPPTPGSEYPAFIWQYLNTKLPGDKLSARDMLIDKWTRLGLLPANPGAALRRMELLTSPLGTVSRVDGRVLRDRAAMLGELSAALAKIALDLQHVQEEIDSSEGTD